MKYNKKTGKREKSLALRIAVLVIVAVIFLGIIVLPFL